LGRHKLRRLFQNPKGVYRIANRVVRFEKSMRNRVSLILFLTTASRGIDR